MTQVPLPKPSTTTTSTTATTESVNAAQVTEVKSSFVVAATESEAPLDDVVSNEKKQG